jgi:hypothetical protein
MTSQPFTPTVPPPAARRRARPTVRELRSGSMFSPEFGGMTANIEFEALTGFSNASTLKTCISTT